MKRKRKVNGFFVHHWIIQLPFVYLLKPSFIWLLLIRLFQIFTPSTTTFTWKKEEKKKTYENLTCFLNYICLHLHLKWCLWLKSNVGNFKSQLINRIVKLQSWRDVKLGNTNTFMVIYWCIACKGQDSFINRTYFYSVANK